MAEVKVRYKGAADVRILPADQLKERGVTGISKDLRFAPENLWSQKVEMSDELEAILRADGAFTIEPIQDDGETADSETDVPEGLDDTASTVEFPDTGQVDKTNDAKGW